MPQKLFQLSFSPASAQCFPTGNRPATSGEYDHSLLPAIVEASEDAIFSKTLDGIITTWNPAAKRMFGYTAAEIIGKPKTTLFPTDRLHEEEAILEHVRQGIPTDHFETIRLHKDGTPIDVSVTISPIKDAAGQIVAASAILRDIAERKRINRELQESEVRFRFLADHAPVFLWQADAEGGCMYVNQPWLDYTGRTMGQEAGNGWSENLHPDDLDAAFETFSVAFRLRQPYRSEYRLRRHDGEYRWHQDTGVPYYTPDGTFLGYIGSVVDIHERKQEEEQATLFASVVAEVLNAVVITDTQERIVYVNQAFERICGYALAELYGRHPADVLHGPETDADTRTRIRAAIDAQEPTTKMGRPTGSRRTLPRYGTGRAR